MQFFRFAGRAFLVVVALGASAIGYVYASTEWLSRRRVEVPVSAPIIVSTDSQTVARGTHLVRAVAGCADCHGTDLGGDTVINEPMVALLTAPNLTRGDGGVLPGYTDDALAIAIRHGVAPGGRVLRFMPSHEFAGLADNDVQAIIAYIRTRAPVNRRVAPVRIGPIMRVLATAGQLTLFPYDRIDHTKRPSAVAPSGPTLENGEYLARGCQGCHGEHLSGGTIPGAPPDWPPAANLTPTGIGSWSEADFMRALRLGRRPDGSAISTRMPWKQLGGMTDDELIAIRRYLATIPARPHGMR